MDRPAVAVCRVIREPGPRDEDIATPNRAGSAEARAAIAEELCVMDSHIGDGSGLQQRARVVYKSAALRDVERAFGHDQDGAGVLGDARIANREISGHEPDR